MKQSKKIIIAVVGYSSSGKRTMSRALASRIGYRYIDSGAMYRAVTLYALEHGLQNADGTIKERDIVAALPLINIDFRLMDDGKQHTILNGRDVENQIRLMTVSNNVSTVAAIPEVRHALVHMQQQFGKSKGIVMDGRDIGTTVFPDAELKIFVNASAETRAQRRYDELKAAGRDVTYDEVLKNVVDRDTLDTTRSESPLRRADDAIDLDNSTMTIQQQNDWLDDQFSRAIAESEK